MKESKEYFRNYYKERKQKYINMLGGKCSICGSDENLQFHHKDRNTKKFSIGKLMNYSEHMVLKELEKCILICKKCHIKQHIDDGTFKECGEKIPILYGADNPTSRKVLCEETSKVYECIADCARDMGFHPYRHKIYAVCSGKRKSYKGFHFRYM